MAATRIFNGPGSSPGGSRADSYRHRLHHHARLVGLFLAITGCFLVYSLIQERLMTLGFGPEHERFSHSLFIILVNRLVACAVAAAALGLAGNSLQPGAPLTLFFVPSLANVLGSASQYEALKYVSFPLQALAKCAKTVPVMAWGLLLGGRKYDRIDYICAGTVTFGCAMFVLTGSIAAPQQLRAADALAALSASAAEVKGGDAGPFASALHGAAAGAVGSWLTYGLLLLGAFLLFDGLTSTTQDRLFAQYEMHSCNQLLWVSLWSAAISFVLLVCGQQLVPALGFIARHPSALMYILALSLVSTAVQLFIFYTIQQYGALHFALIMTMRQFLSIVLSCLVFSHHLSASQWLGTVLVIGGLVARGLHRGGLARTTSVAKLSAMRGKGSFGSATARLLPLSSIPVIEQAGSGEGRLSSSRLKAMANGHQEGLTAATAAAAGAAKKFEGIPVDVQAGSQGPSPPAIAALAKAFYRGSPMAPAGGGAAAVNLAPRRKPSEPV